MLEVVNGVVYKEENFLLDITRRVLHYDLDLGKDIIETGIYPGALKLSLPLLHKASWSFMTKSDQQRFYISNKCILYEDILLYP